MSLTTNDPSAPYGEKREPMLSDEMLGGEEWRVHECGCGHDTKSGGSVTSVSKCEGCGADHTRLSDGWRSSRMDELAVRQYYEDLITKGDLIRREDMVKWLGEEQRNMPYDVYVRLLERKL
jgi:hypothetical protein